MSTRGEILQLIAERGKFEIVSEFSEGMNGYSFRARHLPLQRDVFLKVCDADTASQEVFKEPLSLRRATVGGAANLIELYDAESLGQEFVLMVTELAPGGSLLAPIVAETIGQMEAVHNAIAVLHGVSQLHASGFLHRDIKPANILLCSTGGRLVPKLGDFGSVASISSNESLVTASRHSPLYVPPEGWGTPSVYGIKSDLYELGLVFFEMVNGPFPYDQNSYIDRIGLKEMNSSGALALQDMDPCDASLLIDRCLARRAAAGKILDLRATKPYQSRKIARIIKKACSPRMDERYASAFEFLTALQAISVPNWRSTDYGCEALGWRGWDWQIYTAPHNNEFQLKRKRPQASGYRRWGPAFLTELQIFRLVEDFQS